MSLDQLLRMRPLGTPAMTVLAAHLIHPDNKEKEMIITQIKTAQLEARKARLPETTALLTTMIGECEMAGKNAGNRAPTDAEVLTVLKKFESNMVDNLNIYKQRGMNDQVAIVQKELDTVRLYLPAKLSDEQVLMDIGGLLVQLNLKLEQKSMGVFVKELRAKYGDQFDGGQVSRLFKTMLV